ncbi:hypothetical protein J3E69DRAFT_179553 [Trichoderma sp. SZMC 28015]
MTDCFHAGWDGVDTASSSSANARMQKESRVASMIHLRMMSSIMCHNARFFRKNEDDKNTTAQLYKAALRVSERRCWGCCFTCIPRAWRNARSSRGCVRCAPCRLCSRRPSSSSRRIERTACSAARGLRQWAEGWSPSWMKTKGRRSRKMRRRRSCGWRSMRQRASFGVGNVWLFSVLEIFQTKLKASNVKSSASRGFYLLFCVRLVFPNRRGGLESRLCRVT